MLHETRRKFVLDRRFSRSFLQGVSPEIRQKKSCQSACVFVLVVTFVFLAGMARAGMFVWSAPVPVSTVETTLNLPGTVVGAEVFGNLKKVVVLPDNTTIDFKTDGSVATIINATAPFGRGTTVGAFSGSTGSGDFDSVLDQFSYDGGAKTITLYNLKVGRSYSVQLFALDDRTNSSQNARTASFQDPNDPKNVSAEFQMGGNFYLVGKFTAPDTGDGSRTANVVIRQNLPDSGNGNINALVIRDLGTSLLPHITSQPQSATAYAGGSVKFAVVATARAPVCQWQVKVFGRKEFTNVVDGGDFSGSRTTQLVISNLKEANAADYRVVLSSSSVSLVSSAATLTVLGAPPFPPAGNFAAAVLTNRPIAYWRFNEAESNRPFYDFAGGHHLLNHGIVSGRPGLRAPANPGFSSSNLAAFFDGQNSGASSGLSLMNHLTKFTVMGWFNPAGSQNGSRVGLFGQNDVFELGYNDVEGINLFLQVSGSTNALFLDTGTNGFIPGQWYFTAVVADGANMDIYVNDSLRAHQSNMGSLIGTSVYGFNVGGDGVLDPIGNCFYGSIEDVAVFNKALSPESIRSLYHEAAGMVVPSIILQPQSQARYLGAWVQFTVMAAGTAPLRYQWQASTADNGGFADLKNAGGYSGVTTPNLTITNLTLNHVGNYRVLVSNSVGSTAAGVITLTALSGTPRFIWSAPVPIATVDATLNQPGAIVGAEVFGTIPKTIVLGNNTAIDFQTNGSVATMTNGSTFWGGPRTTTGAFSGTTGNRDFDSVLSQFDFDGGPKKITLHNLVAGRRYSVQLFALDDRIGIPSTRPVNFQSADDAHNISASFTMSDNAYIIATFTATNAETVIQENLPEGSRGNLNALVLRDLGAIRDP